MTTPPRIRGLVDQLDKAVRMEVYANPADKRARKNETLRAKMALLRAFALISQPLNNKIIP